MSGLISWIFNMSLAVIFLNSQYADNVDIIKNNYQVDTLIFSQSKEIY